MSFKRIIAAIVTAGLMVSIIPSTAMAATVGWNGSDKDGWRYYTTSSSYVKNSWKQISGKWYYFNSDGIMESNSYRDGCWLSSSGAWDTRYSKGTWNIDPMSGLFPFIGSLAGGWLRFRTGSLLVPVLGHGLANLAFHMVGGITA